VFDMFGRDCDDLVQKLATKIRAPRIAPRPLFEERIDLPDLADRRRFTRRAGPSSAGGTA
jgi:hypothetical protein